MYNVTNSYRTLLYEDHLWQKILVLQHLSNKNPRFWAFYMRGGLSLSRVTWTNPLVVLHMDIVPRCYPLA